LNPRPQQVIQSIKRRGL